MKDMKKVHLKRYVSSPCRGVLELELVSLQPTIKFLGNLQDSYCTIGILVEIVTPGNLTDITNQCFIF